MEVVDAHQHFGHLADMLGDYENHEPMPDRARWEELEFKARVESMEAIGIDWAVLQPSQSYLNPDGIKDTMRVNDGMATYRKRDPKHFPVVLGTVEPRHGERTMDEIGRCRHELGLNGLSWHPRFSGVFLDNKWMRPILRLMGDLGMVPFIHTNSDSKLEAAWRMQKLASEFPEITLVALDAFMSYEGTLESLHLAENTPNALWIVGPVFSWPMIESWVQRHGSERIAYGGGVGYSTTSPVRQHGLLDQIKRSSLNEQDKVNILGANLRRIFGMESKAEAS